MPQTQQLLYKPISVKIVLMQAISDSLLNTSITATHWRQTDRWSTAEIEHLQLVSRDPSTDPTKRVIKLGPGKPLEAAVTQAQLLYVVISDFHSRCYAAVVVTSVMVDDRKKWRE